MPLSAYYSSLASTNGIRNPQSNPVGGANSDYTAADFRTSAVGGPGAQRHHRSDAALVQPPALVKYWFTKAGVASWLPLWQSANGHDLCRKITSRPLGMGLTDASNKANGDHPNFTGSNPVVTASHPWDPVSDPLDVDNDGDGVPDSVWVDLGMPVRSTSDGRLYKPLFAILCTDLDGRINLNAHGSLTDYANVSGGNTVVTGSGDVFVGGTATTPGGTCRYRPTPRVAKDSVPRRSARFLRWAATPPIISRFLPVAPHSQTPGDTVSPGTAAEANNSGTLTLGPILANKWFQYGQNYWSFIANPGTASVNDVGCYGSPPDPFGAGALGLDQAGRPVYGGTAAASTYQGFGSGIGNLPYELNLAPTAAHGLPSASAPATSNNPFSVTELERILRPFDRDASTLPSRLATLAPSLVPSTANPNGRLSVTTESWDLPCPNVATPSCLSAAQLALIGGRVKHFADLLVARGCPPTTTDGSGNLVWPQLLPLEVLAGLKMNINRPFGNGRDDLSVGVVDSPAESSANNNLKISGVSVLTFSFDGISNATISPTTPQAARQLEARYLYVLMCLTCDLNYLNGQSTINGLPPGPAATARYIAQWAINAVDFRSPGSVMTSFDYDPTFANPGVSITGWNPLGVSGGGICTVWGCKRPDLLISETLAFHDRRTQDLATDTFGSNHTTQLPSAPVDATYDQAYRPQGSLFVELYNPSSPTEPHSKDVYTSVNGAINLAQVALDGGGHTSPVGA